MKEAKKIVNNVQNSVDKDITIINTRLLTSRMEFQRPIDPKRVVKIAKNWDSSQMNPLKVAIIDGVYYVYDGQHTMAAAITLNGGNDLDMPCIAEQMTKERAAQLVAEQYKFSKKLSQLEIFKSEVEANDEDALYIMRVLDKHGIKLSSAAKLDSISCIQTLKRINKIGPFELEMAINIAMESWEDDENRFRTETMAGIEKFIRTYHGEFKESQLIYKLAQNTVMSYIRKGKDLGLGPGTGVASVFVDTYNKGRRKESRLDKSKLLL